MISRAKLLFNPVLGTGMAAVVELFRMADSMRLERSFVVDEGPDDPGVASGHPREGRAIVEGDDEVHFPLEWMLEDMRLSLDAVQGARGVLAAATEMSTEAVGTGSRGLGGGGAGTPRQLALSPAGEPI